MGFERALKRHARRATGTAGRRAGARSRRERACVCGTVPVSFRFGTLSLPQQKKKTFGCSTAARADGFLVKIGVQPLPKAMDAPCPDRSACLCARREEDASGARVGCGWGGDHDDGGVVRSGRHVHCGGCVAAVAEGAHLIQRATKWHRCFPPPFFRTSRIFFHISHRKKKKPSPRHDGSNGLDSGHAFLIVRRSSLWRLQFEEVEHAGEHCRCAQIALRHGRSDGQQETVPRACGYETHACQV